MRAHHIRRNRVRVSRRAKVLDVGSGGHPHSAASFLCDRFINKRHHRNERQLVTDRPFVCADITRLPFRDKEFDYVICNQVIEHIEDAPQALRELSRVGRRGFIAMPSEFLEFLSPHPEHLWVFIQKEDRILMKRKTITHRLPSAQAYGQVFWALHSNRHFKRLMRMHERLFFVRLEYEGDINFQILPSEESFVNYNDIRSFNSLLIETPPSTPGEWIRDWLAINFSLQTMQRVGALYARLRSVLRRL